MDRRLAALAGGVLAAAGALGMLNRRHADASEAPTAPQPDMPIFETPDAPEAPQEEQVISLGWEPGRPFEIDRHVSVRLGASPLPSVTYAIPVTPKPVVRPLRERLIELVASYSMPVDKRLDLTIALREIGDAIEAGHLEEGTAVVDFDWSPGAGLMMSLAVAVLATSSYVRINVCDLQGNLRAPELDVHMQGDDIRVMPDATARTVDLDERRSEAAVTRQKIKAIAQGVKIHPGSAAGVLARCRIAGTPFTS